MSTNDKISDNGCQQVLEEEHMIFSTKYNESALLLEFSLGCVNAVIFDAVLQLPVLSNRLAFFSGNSVLLLK